MSEPTLTPEEIGEIVNYIRQCGNSLLVGLTPREALVKIRKEKGEKHEK